MKNKRIGKKGYLGVSIIIAIFFCVAFLMPTMVFAEELENFSSSEFEDEVVFEEKSDDVLDEQNIKEESSNEEELSNNKDEDSEKENKNETVNSEKENKSEDNKSTSIHKVSCVTTKVDEDGKPLKGAVLQIIDSNGNVVDEWISNGSEHETMLPEGEYTLHEKKAPEGYVKADDKTFTVKVELNEINAGVVHDDGHDVCWHYKGVPLYYVESQGEKQEVYCINQNWDEPNNTNYDGNVLTNDNIRKFAPDADPNLTNEQLYNKILDIIFHRSKAEELFPDLTIKEIRFITEYALKTYTSTLVKDGSGLYMFQDYRYDTSFKSHYVVDKGNGDGIGQLAKHWWAYHGRTTIPEKYAELFYYLINGEEIHPSDMHLYIYSSKELTSEGETYQNLLGVRWYNPYDENHKVYLTLVNEKAPIQKEKKKIKKTKKYEHYKKVYNPQTGDSIFNYIVMLPLSLYGMIGSSVYLRSNRKEY